MRDGSENNFVLLCQELSSDEKIAAATLGFEDESWQSQRIEQLEIRERQPIGEISTANEERTEEFFGWQEQLNTIRWLRCIKPTGLTESPDSLALRGTDCGMQSHSLSQSVDDEESGWVRIVEPGEVLEVLEYRPLVSSGNPETSARIGAIRLAVCDCLRPSLFRNTLCWFRLGVVNIVVADAKCGWLHHDLGWVGLCPGS
eukprot:SAG31_NODE_771_length_12216_cov_5.603862_4_plen_201_part_00